MTNQNDFPNILKTAFVMKHSDLCVVGEYLGYDWNRVCGETGYLSGEDGDGSIIMYREADSADYSDNEVVRAILESIFKNYPDVNEITIIN